MSKIIRDSVWGDPVIIEAPPPPPPQEIQEPEEEPRAESEPGAGDETDGKMLEVDAEIVEARKKAEAEILRLSGLSSSRL